MRRSVTPGERERGLRDLFYVPGEERDEMRGVEPLPGWRATRLERDGFAVEQESTLSRGWWAFRVERDADDGFPRDRWIDELNQNDGFSTALDAMRAVEKLAGKEKPE